MILKMHNQFLAIGSRQLNVAFFVCSLILAVAWDFQQCGMCDQQSLRSACAYEQSDQSLY